MENEKESETNPAKVIKIALGYGTFENRDIGGALYALVDSLVADIIFSGQLTSDTTDSLMDSLLDLINRENAEIAGRDLDDEEEEEEDGEENEDEEDEDEDEIDNSDNEEDEEEDEPYTIEEDEDEDDDESKPKTNNDPIRE